MKPDPRLALIAEWGPALQRIAHGMALKAGPELGAELTQAHLKVQEALFWLQAAQVAIRHAREE